MITTTITIVDTMTKGGETPGLSHELPGMKIGALPRVAGPGMYEGLDMSLG